MVEKLDISVEAIGSKPVNVTVEINLSLTPQAKGIDAQALVKEAINEAHKSSENYLRKIK